MNLAEVLKIKIKVGTPIELEMDARTELVYYAGTKRNVKPSHQQLLFRRDKQGDVYGFFIPYIKDIRRVGQGK